MFRKFIVISFAILLCSFSANAGSDGNLVLSKNKPGDVKTVLRILTEQHLLSTKR